MGVGVGDDDADGCGLDLTGAAARAGARVGAGFGLGVGVRAAVKAFTTIVPRMPFIPHPLFGQWIRQKYTNVPTCVNLCENVCPFCMQLGGQAGLESKLSA